MENLMLFLSSFASYLLVFAVFIVTIVIAVVIGITVRKAVNKQKTEVVEMPEVEVKETTEGE